MPTPQRIKDRSKAARRRECVVCGAEFHVKRADHMGKTCSPVCLKKRQSQIAKARTVSDETRKRQSLAMKKKWCDPAYASTVIEATRKAQKEWHSDPANAAEFARRASERMKRRHADPEWQEVRNARSSRVMKSNWKKHRELFVRQSRERYAEMAENNSGLLSEKSLRNKQKATTWIMKRAQEALHSETDYDTIYADVQARLRIEHPFVPGDDYYEYCRWLGREVVNSEECRSLADSFMSEAIPRFAKEWTDKRPKPDRAETTGSACEGAVSEADGPIGGQHD